MRPLARRLAKLEGLRWADGDVFHLTWRFPGEPKPEPERDHHCFVWEGKGSPPSPRWTTTAKLSSEETEFVTTQLIDEIGPMPACSPSTPEDRARQREAAAHMTNAELLSVMLGCTRDPERFDRYDGSLR